ncbi:MAG TPA: antibiotic biosynthesis monooxygenase [Pseudomonadales bacterium]|nr:antibiotic biosynthesis monooxygenase [Pseudomonadales bacterium]
MSFAPHLEPPYYAVIFTNQLADDTSGYEATADRMLMLAEQQPGFLGVESVRDAQGFGITISYWRDEESIWHWRRHAEHQLAQQEGKARWYEHYELRVAKVERVGKR